MAEILSFDGKKFDDIVDKAKYEEELVSNYDFYIITNSEKLMNEKEGNSFTFTCPGIIVVKKNLGIPGVKEMRIFLRRNYGDEYIDAEAGLRKWIYTKVDILSPDWSEFPRRYPIIYRVEEVVNIQSR